MWGENKRNKPRDTVEKGWHTRYVDWRNTKALAHIGILKHITVSPGLCRQDWSTRVDKTLAFQIFLVFLRTVFSSTVLENRRCQVCILNKSTAKNFTTTKSATFSMVVVWEHKQIINLGFKRHSVNQLMWWLALHFAFTKRSTEEIRLLWVSSYPN